MIPPSRKPDGKRERKVIPFPAPPKPEPGSPPVSPGSGAIPGGIDQGWFEELKLLADEPQTTPLRLTLDRNSAKPLLDFLETTGLATLVRVEEASDDLSILTARPTVSRMIVWQALDFELDFGVSTEA